MEMHLIGSMDNAFQSEEDCEKFLVKSRWANGFFVRDVTMIHFIK